MDERQELFYMRLHVSASAREFTPEDRLRCLAKMRGVPMDDRDYKVKKLSKNVVA